MDVMEPQTLSFYHHAYSQLHQSAGCEVSSFTLLMLKIVYVLCMTALKCITSEVFGSKRCDCKEQLEMALDEVSSLLSTGFILHELLDTSSVTDRHHSPDVIFVRYGRKAGW
jgi:GTP cyclohydrolase II